MFSILVVIGLVWAVPLLTAFFMVFACHVSPSFRRRVSHHLLGPDLSATRVVPDAHGSVVAERHTYEPRSDRGGGRKRVVDDAVRADREPELV